MSPFGASVARQGFTRVDLCAEERYSQDQFDAYHSLLVAIFGALIPLPLDGAEAQTSAYTEEGSAAICLNCAPAPLRGRYTATVESDLPDTGLQPADDRTRPGAAGRSVAIHRFRRSSHIASSMSRLR
jgi:hypothetical protein